MVNYREELNKAIDFDRVLEQVASFASFSCSKNEIKDSLPLHDRMEIMEHLDLVKEGLEFVRSGTWQGVMTYLDMSPKHQSA